MLSISVIALRRYDKAYNHCNQQSEYAKTEMDWSDPKDRVALVKECGFCCRHPIAEDCKDCSAKEFCDEAVREEEET